MTPSAELLEKLSSSRFLVSHAPESGRIGERRSRAKGAGIEFVEHRAYRRGDDTRHLDARLLARFNKPYVRLYTVDRQLPVTIVVDASASMQYGKPDKFIYACLLAQLLGFVGLVGGDQVRIAMAGTRSLSLSSRFSGRNQADLLFQWVRHQSADGQGRFGDGLEQSRRHIGGGGLVLLISDWWDENIDRTLDGLINDQHEIVAIHVVAPEEIDPSAIGTGECTMIDSETGEEIEVMVDADVSKRYRAVFSNWCNGLRQRLSRREIPYFHVSSALDPQSLLLKQMRTAGVIS